MPRARSNRRRAASSEPDFVHKGDLNYAAKKDFWRVPGDQRPALAAGVTDRLADAGIATVNFAVDTI